MNRVLNRVFRLQENRTTPGREITAGLVTFAAMSYIVCVQPALLSGQMTGTLTGMDPGALFTTTCIVSLVGCLLMGILSRYPIALAPGMGTNFLLVLSGFPFCAALLGKELGDAEVWKLGLGIVFVSGIFFLLISLTRLRELIMQAISPDLRHAIAAGIGLFIALLGLKNAGMIGVSGSMLKMNYLWNDLNFWIFMLGLVVIAVLSARKVNGAILIGIGVAALAGFLTGKIQYQGLVGLPADPRPLLLAADLEGVFTHFWKLLPLIMVFLCMDVFDTIGTVLSVGLLGGFVRADGEMPRIRKVFLADALATLTGAAGGHSTVTSYIESLAGVESGGRTGMVAIVAGLCFIPALFLAPLVMAIASYPPVTASALVTVGALMMKCAGSIKYDDFTEGVPAFIIMTGIPFGGSISGGMAIGCLIYPVIKLLSGRGGEVKFAMWVLAAAMGLYLYFAP